MMLFNIYLLAFCFLTLACFIIFLSRHKQSKPWKTYLKVNALVFIVGACLFCFRSKNITLTVLADWFPLSLIFYFYHNAGLLSRAFHAETFDNHIIQFEKKIFGAYYPCIQLSETFNSYWLSEFLHLCYLSYFFLLYGIPLYFYFYNEYTAFYQFSFAELLVFLTSSLVHSIVPVLSPRTIFEKIQQPLRKGVIYRFTHWIQENGSADGTGFPSVHVGIGTLMLLFACHIHTLIFYFVFIFSLGLIISTVYGRFHYIVDMLGGIFCGSLVFIIMYT
ncbi:MAG: hypothetical protein A3E82_01655 [Gammaproteobacteria bacterium RIFCSPHIGHO2_12_FULL_38_11]|nr:MAG: hypothetical protein A3E82_01655 [Gammaproteobacteria bacterium RIFCSPHIGHO2_12_FULL_38_11]